MIFDRDILPDQRIEIVYGARIGLRSGHEGFHADVYREAALDAAQHAARDHELFVVRLLELIPHAQTRGARVREQDISFRLRAAVIDHHVDGIAAFDGHFARGGLKLLDGNEAFALVAEIDDDFLGRDAEHRPLEDFIAGRRREMRIVFEEVFVLLEALLALPVIVCRHRLRPSPDFTGNLSPRVFPTEQVYPLEPLKKLPQTLRDQYVSKYTPSDGGLSNGA